MTGTPGVRDAAEWDERYAGSDRIWSGRPNGALVAEASALPPGRALDVGCGEGADSLWLAARGWSVTALEVSSVALARAQAHAGDADVAFVHSGLEDAGLTGFDLVSAMYPALRHAPGDPAVAALLTAVAPGGTLLVVHHVLDPHHPPTHFDPADYVAPGDVAALLDDGWAVQVHEEREREVPPSGGGTHHTRDVVLRARRRV